MSLRNSLLRYNLVVLHGHHHLPVSPAGPAGIWSKMLDLSAGDINDCSAERQRIRVLLPVAVFGLKHLMERKLPVCVSLDDINPALLTRGRLQSLTERNKQRNETHTRTSRSEQVMGKMLFLFNPLNRLYTDWFPWFNWAAPGEHLWAL